MKKITTIYLLIAFLTSATKLSLGQGFPIIQFYKAEQYGGSIQIWDIDIDKNGVAYFANNGGISVFDGTEWINIPNIKKSHIRCLKRTHDDKLYAGGSSDFGYYTPNEKGQLIYTSLNSKLEDSSQMYADIWSMAGNNEGIIFAVNGGIMYYDFKTIRKVMNAKGVINVFDAHNQLFAHVSKKGFFEFSQGQWKPLPGLNALAKEMYVKVLPYNNKNLFIIGEQTGLWIYNYHQIANVDSTKLLVKVNNPIAQNITNELLCYATYDSTRQTIYITTVQSVYGISPNGELKIILNHQRGLGDFNTLSAKTDKLGNLWVGCNSGVAYAHVASPIRLIDSRMGIIGHPYAQILADDHSYFTNIGGLYSIKTEELFSPAASKLYPIYEQSMGAWAMIPVEDEIVVSLTSAIYRLKNNKLSQKPLLNLTAYSLAFLHPNKKTLIIGTPQSCFIMPNYPQKELQPIEQINGAIRQLLVLSPTQVVGNVSYLGIFNLYYDSLNNHHFEWIVKPGSSNEIPTTFKFKNNIYFSTSTHGIQKVVFTKDSRYDTLTSSHILSALNQYKYNVVDITEPDSTNSAYALTTRGIIKLHLDSSKIVSLKHQPYRIFPNSYTVQKFRNYVVTQSINGLNFFDETTPSLDTIAFSTKIQKIIVNGDTVFYGFKTPDKDSNFILPQPIAYTNNHIIFTFTAPYMFYQDSITYECRLLGYDKNWTSLGNKNQKEYTNLPHGSYTFEVRAKNIFNNYSLPESVSFTIETPWFLTWIAKILFALTGMISFYVMIKFYTHRLKIANRRLEQIVYQRTLEIEQKSKSLLEQHQKIIEQNQKISEQANFLKEVNKQLKQLSVVAEATENGIMVFQKPFEIQYINNGIINLLGFSNKQGSKGSWNSVVIRYFESIKPKVENVFNTGESVFFETFITPQNMSKKWLQISLSPILDDDKNVSQVVAVCTDITALKLAEEEISQQQEELMAQSELLENINAELEKTNQLMRDSINYAQRIQTSMLPDLSELKKDVTDSFVFYKPRDIVSGDFFWYKKAYDVHILVVADCTGHGVPGAFMSMIGQTLLKETIQGHIAFEPEIILNELNNSIRSILKQNNHAEEIQDDGIDMSVCVYMPSDNLVRIALANHFAYLISENEIMRIDGDIFSVGGQFSSKPNHQFMIKELFVNKGDALYLFTDGFPDQLGGEKYSKYSTLRFEKLLKRIHKLPSEDQLEILNDEFSMWRGNKRQTDDILIWGIQF